MCLGKILHSVMAEKLAFFASAIVSGAIYWYVLFGMGRMPTNPVDIYDQIFFVLFVLSISIFVAAWKHAVSGPKVCNFAGGVGLLAGLWTMACPFCSLFLLVWLGVPAGAGALNAPWLEQPLLGGIHIIEIVRLIALAILWYGIALLAKNKCKC